MRRDDAHVDDVALAARPLDNRNVSWGKRLSRCRMPMRRRKVAGDGIK